MPRLILPRPGLYNRPIKPNRSNKFGRHVSIWTAPMLMQMGDLAGDMGGQFVLPGKGVRVDATNYSDPGLEFNIKPQPSVDLEKFTMVYLYQRPEDTCDSFGHYFRFDSAGDTSVRLEQNGSVGNAQYYDLNDNGGAFNDIQPISANTDNRHRAFIFTVDHDAGNMRFWVSNPEDSFFLFGDNGVSSEVSLSGSPAGPTEVTRLHIGRDNNGTNSFIDLRAFLGMFAFIPGRYLNPAELIALGNNPWQMFAPTLELPVFTPSAAGGTDALEAEDISSSPTVGTPTLGVIHNLVADNIASAPSVGTPDIGQTHALTADDITSTASVGTPTLTGPATDALEAESIVSSPSMGQPTLEAIAALTADSITSTPSVGQPTLGQVHAFSANGLTAQPSTGTPDIAQVHALVANDIVSGATVGAPDLDPPPIVTQKDRRAALEMGLRL